MDDFKKKQLQEFFTLLEDDSVSCQIDEDEECVLVDFPNEMDTSSYDVDDFLDYIYSLRRDSVTAVTVFLNPLRVCRRYTRL